MKKAESKKRYLIPEWSAIKGALGPERHTEYWLNGAWITEDLYNAVRDLTAVYEKEDA